MLGLLLYAIHDFLDRGRPPEPADCIFAHAGRPERKTYALRLYRQRLAPRAILSVGRYEWRSVRELGLPDDGGLARLATETAPGQRHFFLSVGPDGPDRIECRLVPGGPFGTLSEARALARLLAEQGCRSVLLVSSGFHLRRAAWALRRCSTDRSLKIIPVAVSQELAREKRDQWWRSKRFTRLIAAEYLKNGLYPILARLSSLRS